MELQEAIKILDPDTTRETLSGLNREEAIEKVNEACVVACKVMRRVLEQRALQNCKL